MLFHSRILNMADSKNITQTLQAFSQKLKSFSQSDTGRIIPGKTDSTNLKNLQNQINRQEQEKMALLRSQLEEFLMPITQDIEKDEETLLKAYELYRQLKSLNEEAGDRQTHLKSLALSSPICHKTEYTSEGSNRFAFLRLWFLSTIPDAAFFPEIIQESNGSFALDFTDIELWQPSTLEKEIMQAFSEASE